MTINEKRIKIRAAWGKFVPKVGKEMASDFLVALCGAKNPGAIMDSDVDMALANLEFAAKHAESDAPALPEGRAPKNFAANIRARHNNPRRRNPISGEVTELPDGTPLITIEKPDEDATRSPRESVDDPLNPPRREPNVVESDPEGRAPVGTFGKRRPVSTKGKKAVGDLADDIWRQRHDRDREQLKKTTR